MLRWRLLLIVVFIWALVGLCWLDWRAARPGIWLLPLAIAAALLAAGELLAMFRTRAHRPLAWVVYGGTLLTVVAAAVPGLVNQSAIPNEAWMLSGVVASLILALVGELWRYDGSGRATDNLSLA